MSAEIVTAVASTIAALGVVFVGWQARTASKQFKADHERSRRQHAIEVLRRWTESLDKAQPAARKFVQGLSEDQCRQLIKREPFNVNEKHSELLKHALQDIIDSDTELVSQNGLIELNQKHISELLVLIIDHLNTLEVALLSWMNGVADKDIIESQFEYLVRFEDGHFVLENLRKVMAGKGNFPAIDLFVAHLTKKYEQSKPKVKPQIT